jgi:hypothetical protein
MAMSRQVRAELAGPAIMAIGAVAGLIVAVIAYFVEASGIDHTGGALLVVASSACLLIGAILEMTEWIRQHWTGPTITVLMILGIAGTFLAAAFLESLWLEIAIAVCFVGWLIHVFWRPQRDLALAGETYEVRS